MLFNNISPEVGLINPAIRSTVVDLPAPEGPYRRIKSPAIILKDKFFKQKGPLLVYLK